MSTRDPLVPENRDPLMPEGEADAIILEEVEEEGTYVDAELPVDAVLPKDDDRLDDADDDLGVTRDAADEDYRHG
jgi:hypothetical protein